jgi:hypothetical protein
MKKDVPRKWQRTDDGGHGSIGFFDPCDQSALLVFGKFVLPIEFQICSGDCGSRYNSK